MAPSVLDSYVLYIRERIKDGLSNVEIMEALKRDFDLGTSETSVRNCIKRHPELQVALEDRKRIEAEIDIDRASGIVYNDDGSFIMTTPKSVSPLVTRSVEEYAEQKGIDLNEYVARKILPKSWMTNVGGGEIVEMHSFAVWFEAIVPYDILFPATDPGPLPARPKPRDTNGKKWLWVGLWDAHCPYHEPGLETLTHRWLAENTPDRALFGGDTPDYPDQGKYANKLEYNADVMTCVNATFKYVRDMCYASPATQWQFMEGNHDKRIQKQYLDKLPGLAGLRPAEWPERYPAQSVVYSPQRLFHLDDLGVELIEEQNDYQFAICRITPGIAAIHGSFHGTDALKKHLETYNHDLIYGHLHSAGLFSRTRWHGYNETHETITTYQSPMMAELTPRGLGYRLHPDWNQGFTTVQVSESGEFHVEFAKYRDGVLTWRDQVYTL